MGAKKAGHAASQITLPLQIHQAPMTMVRDERVREAVVAVLARLLLEAASPRADEEVADERS